MDFFDNELIRSEAAEMMQIYEDLQALMQSYKFRTQEGGKKYLFMMERLLELQEMVYFRAKYSEESDAKDFVNMLMSTLPFVAKEGETDASQVFRRMREEISEMKKFVEEP
tara:strand:- start:1851 stop:2183 length:333 start_codon:yes stop_codon:yes gene_type:complete